MSRATSLRRSSFLLGFLAVVVAVAGTALACVPQPLVSLQPRSSGLPGSRVRLSAVAVNGAAEIRWNAIDGQLLATGSGPSFSVDITIPDEPEGLYAVFVLERRPDGSLGSSGRAAFEITPAPRDGVASGSATSATTAGGVSSTAPQGGPSSRSSSGVAALAVAGGVGLAVGSVGGVRLARRGAPRRRREPR